jgi:sterol desaturase/sphingolipid hydroxylase (fatty acid hydroxylase superfamily)
MKFEKINNKGQARLFKNPVLESLSKTHPLVIWGMYLPVIIYLPYYSSTHFGFSFQKIGLLFIAGGIFWTFFEYMAHRYLFHMEAKGKTAQRIAYTMHGNHHEFPRDRNRLFMPAVPSIILSSTIFLIMYLLMGRSTFVFFPGFILGYLSYASMHYAIHAWNPPFKWLKPLWRNHHLHHYKADHKGYGVSSSLWDYVFGTGFDLKNEKEDKEQVQALMFEKRH